MTSPELPAGLPSLSPSERMVLGFVKDGLLDAEIAVRLGVTHGDVKTRIAVLLRKLGLSERAALRTWDPAIASLPAAPLDAAVVPGDPPAAPRPLRFSAWQYAGCSLALLAILVAAGAWLFWGGQASPGVSTAPPAAVASPAPGFAAPSTATVTTLRFGRDFDLQDYSLLVETGCSGCGAGPDGIVRVTRSGRGAPAIERLMPPESVLGGPVTSLTFDREGWLGAITVCTGPNGCSSGDNPTSAIWLSNDGGVTWRKQGDMPGVTLAQAWSGGRLLLSDSNQAPGPGLRYIWLGDTSAAAPYPESYPVGALEDGRILWALRDGGQLSLGDGTLLASPRFPGRTRIVSVTPVGDDRLYAVWQDLELAPARTLSGVILPDGTLERVLTGTPAWTPVRIGAGLLLQTAGIPPAFVPGDWSEGIVSNPLVLDLARSELRPVPSAWTLAEEFRLGRNVIHAFRPGPLVRVRAPVEGGCVPVYARPDPASPLLRCFATGVLVRGPVPMNDPQARVENSGVWVAISWPGATGWAQPSGLEWR